MSDLQRSFTRAHLQRLPPEPPPALNELNELKEIDEEEEEEEEAEQAELPSPSQYDSSSSASSTGTIVPSASQNLFERPKATTLRARNAPLPWQDFFSQELFFEQSGDKQEVRHHVYLTPPTSSGPLFVTHHGAGSSGLSFAAFGAEIRKLLPDAGVLSTDARDHGETTVQKADQLAPKSVEDLTLTTLASDLAFVVNAAKTKLGWTTLPHIVLLGHSLGGAVVVELANRRLLGDSILGYGVLDVVEGSAMDALQSMEAYLSTRPKSFASVSSGIEWHTRSRTIRNTTSARVSVPSLLELSDEGQKWTWRTDLAATKPFWEGWFTGLSKKFLESRGGKLLLLAGTDRLDKELMIGQMQGKYQLQVFPEAGHFVHEDQPAKTASVVADFFKRNDRSAFVLPPKVGDLIKQGKLKPTGAT